MPQSLPRHLNFEYCILLCAILMREAVFVPLHLSLVIMFWLIVCPLCPCVACLPPSLCILVISLFLLVSIRKSLFKSSPQLTVPPSPLLLCSLHKDCPIFYFFQGPVSGRNKASEWVRRRERWVEGRRGREKTWGQKREDCVYATHVRKTNLHMSPSSRSPRWPSPPTHRSPLCSSSYPFPLLNTFVPP